MDRNDPHAARQTAGKEPLRLLDIMGVSRSGSTMLDTILGNHPDVESVGEVCHLPIHGWVMNRYCACRRRANDCSFWSDVRRQWDRLTGGADVERFAALLKSIEERRLWLPGWIGEARLGSPRLRQYAPQIKALFTAIRQVSGKSIIVDSSKRITRALFLSTIPGIDLRVIHLVRDSRAVAWSKKKTFKKDEEAGVMYDVRPQRTMRTALSWNLRNLAAEWMRRQLAARKSIRLCYEDYASRPQEALDAIGRLIDVDLGNLGRSVAAGAAQQFGHTIAGNHLRMSGSTRLSGADVEWIEKLSPRDRRVCWLVTGPLLRRYGYGKVVESAQRRVGSSDRSPLTTNDSPRAGEIAA